MAGNEPTHDSDPVVLNREEHECLREEAARAAEYKELLQRTRADFLNYQDRAAGERSQASERAVADFAAQFLEALDALHEGRGAMERDPEPKALLDAVRLTEREIHRILAKNEVYPIQALGEPFDPAVHEAIGFVETDGSKDGVVVEEVRPGYQRRDRVLRPALVRVARRRKEVKDGESGQDSNTGGAGAGARAGGGPA